MTKAFPDRSASALRTRLRRWTQVRASVSSRLDVAGTGVIVTGGLRLGFPD
jgi:hypothetical protein